MHFVQVHRVQKYGSPQKGEQFEVFTKKVEVVHEAMSTPNGIMWLIRSDSSNYSIAWRYEIEGVTTSDNPEFSRDFNCAIYGTKGQEFDPPLSLTAEALAHLVRCTHDFRHGCCALDDEAVLALEKIVGKRQSSNGLYQGRNADSERN